jgi:integration host factor subunit alpha
MTKADIIEKINAIKGLSKKDSAVMMESVFTIMKESLEAGETIKISGFGNFEVIQKAARKSSIPQTGEAITIAARKVLNFKPSTVLRQAVNGEVK